VFLLGVFVVALVIRLHRIGTLSAWQDETKEAMDVVESVEHDGLASGALVRHVQRFGQPPLSYYLQQIAIANAGLTVVGIRMHSAILGAAMCVVAALLWLRLWPPGSRAWPWSFGLLAIPVFAPRMVYYGQEARPYSTALLLSTVYLLVLHEFLFRGRGRVRAEELLVLAAAQLALLFSVGFQPAVIVFTACLAMAPLALRRTLRRRVLWSWGTALLAFLIFLPWQRIFLSHYTLSPFDRSDLSRLAREHESVQLVFAGHPLRCLVVVAGPDGMLVTLRPVFDEWEAWMGKRYPGGDGPSYVRDGARILRLLVGRPGGADRGEPSDPEAG
jgi:hypothetical protein